MEGSCQCRAVRFKTPDLSPIQVYHCHCSQCRHQSSSAFGTSAIFYDFKLDTNAQPIGVFSRPTKTGAVMDCFFCKVCGSRILHKTRAPDQSVGENNKTTVSVKGGCLEGLDWSQAIHIHCRDAVYSIPDHAERHDGSPPPDD